MQQKTCRSLCAVILLMLFNLGYAQACNVTGPLQLLARKLPYAKSISVDVLMPELDQNGVWKVLVNKGRVIAIDQETGNEGGISRRHYVMTRSNDLTVAYHDEGLGDPTGEDFSYVFCNDGQIYLSVPGPMGSDPKFALDFAKTLKRNLFEAKEIALYVKDMQRY